MLVLEVKVIKEILEKHLEMNVLEAKVVSVDLKVQNMFHQGRKKLLEKAEKEVEHTLLKIISLQANLLALLLIVIRVTNLGKY